MLQERSPISHPVGPTYSYIEWTIKSNYYNHDCKEIYIHEHCSMYIRDYVTRPFLPTCHLMYIYSYLRHTILTPLKSQTGLVDSKPELKIPISLQYLLTSVSFLTFRILHMLPVCNRYVIISLLNSISDSGYYLFTSAVSLSVYIVW